MENKEEEKIDETWKKFLRKHWKMTLLLIGAGAGAVVGALLVFLWVVANAQATGLVPIDLGMWTVGYTVTFIINVILWELLFIGIPVVVAAILIIMLWWKKLPEEEREEYKREPKKGWRRRGTSSGGGGGIISFLVMITWLIIIWVDNMWNIAFEDWFFNYWIYSGLAAFLWVLLIFGVPITILIILWLRRELKE
ncbi:MAG: hypothetical protein ACTSQI_18075 [Candidatus Helarchaeota archaeon]